MDIPSMLVTIPLLLMVEIIITDVKSNILNIGEMLSVLMLKLVLIEVALLTDVLN
jgi:hypothetical protein